MTPCEEKQRHFQREAGNLGSCRSKTPSEMRKAQGLARDQSPTSHGALEKSSKLSLMFLLIKGEQGCLGGSVVEHLLSAQGRIPGSWEESHTLGSLEGACFSLCLHPCLSLYVSRE